MGADLAAELLKLGKRPSTWILGAILFVAVLLFSYVLIYALAAALPAAGEARAGDTQAGTSLEAQPSREELMGGLLPESLLESVLPASSGLGGTLALILGVLAVGSEYGWGTLKTVLTQGSGRVGVLFGKLLAVGVVLVGFVLLALAAGAIGSYGVALLEDSPVNWPPLGDLARGAGAAWLILTVWATLGAFLAVLFRGTSLAIGLGLVYALVLEAVITGLPAKNEALEEARKTLPGQSSSALAGSFGPPTQGAPGAPTLLDPGQATLVLILYVVVFCLLAALVLRGRDVG